MRIPKDFATNAAYHIPFLGEAAAAGTATAIGAGGTAAGTAVATAASVVLPVVAVAAAGYGVYRLIKWARE